MGDGKQTRTTPKVGNKASVAKTEQPESNTPGGRAHSPMNWETDPGSITQHGAIDTLFEKYADEVTGDILVSRLVDGTGLTRKSLADTLSINVKALYRTDRVNSRIIQLRMREMLEILGRVAGWAGGELRAMPWYRAQPIPAFGGRTAESLVKCDQAGPLRDYLDHMARGGFA